MISFTRKLNIPERTKEGGAHKEAVVVVAIDGVAGHGVDEESTELIPRNEESFILDKRPTTRTGFNLYRPIGRDPIQRKGRSEEKLRMTHNADSSDRMFDSSLLCNDCANHTTHHNSR